MPPVLTCNAVSITYANGATPVQNLSFHVNPGECFALLGRSGSGKSTIAKALLGLHQRSTRMGGTLELAGQNMTTASPETWRAMRGREVGFVAQNPWSGCDPLRSVGDHVAQAWRCHGLAVSWEQIAARLAALGVAEAGTRMHRPPHTWSGGMLQRASIAAASALSPPLIIADEPTSALDAHRAQSVLEALRTLGAAVVLISHDMELVLANANRIGVLHDGILVEQGSPENLKNNPHRIETKRLLRALSPLPPRLGTPDTPPVLKMDGVSKSYDRSRVQALRPADLQLSAGEIVGVQGPSGCGKSTLLRLAMGLEAPSGGTLWRAACLASAGAVLPVFQDPVSSLVPHWPIWRSVSEPLSAPRQPRLSRKQRITQACEALNAVGLSDISPGARPSELSVGQCQRVAVARATIARPALIVADEPTSALDTPSTFLVSKLLRGAAEGGAGVLIVSHDAVFLQRLADRVITLKGPTHQPST